MPVPPLTPAVPVEEEIREEPSQETWLREIKIEEAIEETILESNGILETLQEAVEDCRADVEDAIPSCSRGVAGALADVTDARLVDLKVDTEEVAAGDAQSSAALAAPVSGGFGLEATTEADPEWLTAFYCKLHEDGRERQTPALPTSPTPESLGHGLGQGSMTPAHQALHVARQYMQIPHTNAELCQFVRTLAIELGASRKEAGTGGNKVAPSPNEVPAVACCKLLHDPKGNTAFVCRYPGCGKSYASRDAVRKHCRIHHLQWLRTLERVTTHARRRWWR